MTMQEAKSKRKTIQNQAIYVEGKTTFKTTGSFSNPVKPMEIKLKNFTLSTKVPVNLCEQLSQEGTSTCPILGTNCVSNFDFTSEGDVKTAEELNNFVKEKEERENEEGSASEEV